MSWGKFCGQLLGALLKIAVIGWFYIFLARLLMFFSLRHSSVHYCIIVFLYLSFLSLLIVWYIKKEDSRNTFSLHDVPWRIGLWAFLLYISEFLFIAVFYGNPVLIPKSMITTEYILRTINPIFFAPVVEEIVFRGLLQKNLLLKIAPWIAILITSVLFALIHLNRFEAILPAFLLGICCGIIYYKTGKLIVCILFHSFSNILAAATGFTFVYFPFLQIFYLILAIGLATYSIRGFLNYKTENKNPMQDYSYSFNQ